MLLVNMMRRNGTIQALPNHLADSCIASNMVKAKLWAEQIPRPYSRAEENARELNGRFGMTTLPDIEAINHVRPRSGLKSCLIQICLTG